MITFLLGKVDYVGSSHQLWHVIVVLAFMWWRHTTQVFLTYRQDHTCYEMTTAHV